VTSCKAIVPTARVTGLSEHRESIELPGDQIRVLAAIAQTREETRGLGGN
jgi:hypothetical protein